ncbi:hypothetical protein [Microbacterium rhizophilus]|uniref:hypothetical protein n=1 Tax=Microbacterium rhizophilus TaxID=3138934 RepID=UPI0031ECA4AC
MARRLKPELHSPIIGTEPATSVEDIRQAVREHVEEAQADTDARIDALTQRIENDARDRAALIGHRNQLQAWLDQNAERPPIIVNPAPGIDATAVAQVAARTLRTTR